MLLPVFLRFAARSAAKQTWLYGHRIDWDQPIATVR